MLATSHPSEATLFHSYQCFKGKKRSRVVRALLVLPTIARPTLPRAALPHAGLHNYQLVTERGMICWKIADKLQHGHGSLIPYAGRQRMATLRVCGAALQQVVCMHQCLPAQAWLTPT